MCEGAVRGCLCLFLGLFKALHGFFRLALAWFDVNWLAIVLRGPGGNAMGKVKFSGGFFLGNNRFIKRKM